MSGFKLFVGNLSWNTNENGLREAFSECGQVTESVVMKDRETGRARGFGFVTFNTQEEAQAAIEKLHDQDLDGRRIRVNMAESKGGGGSRGGGGGGYGGGGGGYGGSSGYSW